MKSIDLIVLFRLKVNKEITLKAKGARKVVLLTEMNATRKDVILAHLLVAGEIMTFNKRRKVG
jgi:hypothetical protein